jgi:hypothetical protein
MGIRLRSSQMGGRRRRGGMGMGMGMCFGRVLLFFFFLLLGVLYRGWDMFISIYVLMDDG